MALRYGTHDGWALEEDSFDPNHLGKCESIMALGNGYMGVRSATEEPYVGQTRDTLVNGTFDRFDDGEVTELPNVPDVTEASIWVDGERFSLLAGSHEGYSRELDVRTGELRRSVEWTSCAGKRVRLAFRRMVSLERMHALASTVSVTALDEPLDILVRTGIDGRVTNEGSQHFSETAKRLYDNRYLQMVETTRQSDIAFVVSTVQDLRIDGEGDASVGADDVACDEGAVRPGGDGAGDAEPALAKGAGSGAGSGDDAPAGAEGRIEVTNDIERRRLSVRYSLRLQPGETLTMEKIADIRTSRDLDALGMDVAQLQEASLEALKEREALGFDALLEESAATWRDQVWDAIPIEIRGSASADVDQFALRFAQYHLRIMDPRHDERMNIGAKGLTGEGYKGHTFWDTEIFLLPYYMFCDPQAARRLETYRYLSLPGAHRKAADNGYEGAMFPWESAWLDDGETCPLYGGTDVVTGTEIKIWSGIIEQHITADVAFGAWQYYEITQDQVFMDDRGYELIMDAAIFWASRLEEGDDGLLHINDVVGPDEYHEHVNDNAFTNYMARWTLMKAIEYHDLLKAERPEVLARLDERLDLERWYPRWCHGAAHIALPVPNEQDVLPMDDRFLTLADIDLSKYKDQKAVGEIMRDFNLDQIQGIQVSKQADVLVLFFLMEDLFGPEVKKASFDYYEPRTLHDSSLSLSTHAVLAADLGLTDMAYELFQRASMIDLGPKMNSSDAGVHAASFGGVWEAAIYGFGGLRMVGGRLLLRPHLPEAWDELRYRVHWHGQALDVVVRKDEVTVANLTGTEAVIMEIEGEQVVVDGTLTRSLEG